MILNFFTSLYLLLGVSYVAQAKSTMSVQEGDCSRSNFKSSGFSYFQLKDRYQEALAAGKNPNTKEALIALAPERYRRGFVLIYDSKSLQSASFKYPRLVLTGTLEEDLNEDFDDMMMAVSSDPHGTKIGDNKIEIIEFNRAKDRFCPRTIDLSNNAVSFNDHPDNCNTCHRADLRPNLDAYTFWPGFVGGFIEGSPKNSLEYKRVHEELIPTVTSMPLFRDNLVNLRENLWDFSGWGTFSRFQSTGKGTIIRLVDSMGEGLTSKNNRRISRMIRETDDHARYRYAILAAFAKCSDLESYLPAEILANHPKSLNDVRQETLQLMNDGWQSRRNRSMSFGVDPSHQYIAPNQDILYGSDVIASMRFLLENRAHNKHDLSSWSMAFDRREFAFADGNGPFPSNIGSIYASQAFKDRRDLLELSGVLVDYNQIPGYGGPRANLCESLKTSSLDAFRQ